MFSITQQGETFTVNDTPFGLRSDRGSWQPALFDVFL